MATMNIYAHVLPNSMHEAAAKIDALLAKSDEQREAKPQEDEPTDEEERERADKRAKNEALATLLAT
jgi:hypothetical protein